MIRGLKHNSLVTVLAQEKTSRIIATDNTVASLNIGLVEVVDKAQELRMKIQAGSEGGRRKRLLTGT